MARLNTPRNAPKVFTHEGGPAVAGLRSIDLLRRSVMSCLLWENEFYEDGQEISDRIKMLAGAASSRPVLNRPNPVSLDELAQLTLDARQKFGLRHVPLLLASILAGRANGHERPQGVSDVVDGVIGRVDELSEILKIYLILNPTPTPKSKRRAGPISRQFRKGLARAMYHFDRYQYGKYSFDKGKDVKLRDVLRIARPRPRNEAESSLFRDIRDNAVYPPDTWEVALMRGADKCEIFTRLIEDGRLGYMALLRNLRNMNQAGVDHNLINDAIIARKGARWIWPFRYVAAARAAPMFEPALDKALIASIADMPQLTGKTVVLVDVSGSMDYKMSGKSDMIRMDAAATLASIIPGDTRVFTFSERCVEVPARKGMAGVDVIKRSQSHQGTNLGLAVRHLNSMAASDRLDSDRLIVITDEQTSDRVPKPWAEHAYMVNVASYQNGVGYRDWIHIDGFSDSILRFISEYEKGNFSRVD